jgi:hypothetical protein
MATLRLSQLSSSPVHYVQNEVNYGEFGHSIALKTECALGSLCHQSLAFHFSRENCGSSDLTQEPQSRLGGGRSVTVGCPLVYS